MKSPPGVTSVFATARGLGQNVSERSCLAERRSGPPPCHPSMHKTSLCALMLLLCGPAAAQGESCDALRARIEAQVAAKGVTGFTVRSVDADVDVPGRTVGRCELGRKKIVYARTAGPVELAGAAGPRRPTRDEDIWVECKDGSMVKGGGCRR